MNEKQEFQKESEFAIGFRSHSIVETTDPRVPSIVIGPQSRSISRGIGAASIATDDGSLTYAKGRYAHSVATGHNCTVITDGAISHGVGCGKFCVVRVHGENAIASALGLGSKASASAETSAIILTYFDGHRVRARVLYVGEDIEPDKTYKLDRSGQIEEVFTKDESEFTNLKGNGRD